MLVVPSFSIVCKAESNRFSSEFFFLTMLYSLGILSIMFIFSLRVDRFFGDMSIPSFGERKEAAMKILISACLLGENCKYNGGNNYSSAVAEFVRGKEILPICPELMAGMGCPRTPIEIVDGVLMDRDGKNVDTAMREAVEMAMKQISSEEIQCAVLQSRSPTCGVNQVYDGSFSGKLIPGAGIFAQALKEAGYRVIDAEDVGKE